MPDLLDPPTRRRLVGGRVGVADTFPEASTDFEDRTPAERIEALRTLSRRLYETAKQPPDGRPGHPRLPDRLVGGRR